MGIGQIILSVLGLCVFEVISSIDNAVVNADVLATMDKKWRKWFLIWGIFFGVFLVRGLLPWIIIWVSSPALGPWGSFMAAFSSDPQVETALEQSSPLLMMGGGIFLVFLFFHWLFLEHKKFGLPLEYFFRRQGVWFFAVVSTLLSVIIWHALKKDPMLAFAASIGASAFFITHGFKQYAEQAEVELKNKSDLSDISKIMYLEVLDATFSIDGVVGAFAFTMSVPLIILGNGLGAFVVREFTIRGVDKIKKYVYLKNGAMYSIFFLGMMMLLEGFGIHVPHYVAPVMTFMVIGFFFFKSLKEKKDREHG
ncbi:MAG TPA: hypothetical protein DD723_01145 [Candidatus Omnitrophica bacterium]|nr:MAG: hypothetical protein A2Z81_02280 [Omnitrophica WOR_2 bacterium GWA2_45_18]HBR14136.1 hypothetical protein [Candidatus Omnitrophota bacterium]